MTRAAPTARAMTIRERHEVPGVGQPHEIGLRVDVVEQRVRLEPGRIRPQRAEDVEEVRHQHHGQADPDRRRQAVERDRREQGDGAERPEQERAVQPHQPEVADAQLSRTSGQGGPDERPGDQGPDRDRDERRTGCRERQVDASPREGPRQQHLERAPLAFARDGRGCEPDREDEVQPHRDRVDEAQRDRAGQAEDVAAAELGELRRHGAAVEELLELRAECVDRRSGGPCPTAAVRPPRSGAASDSRATCVPSSARFMRTPPAEAPDRSSGS